MNSTSAKFGSLANPDNTGWTPPDVGGGVVRIVPWWTIEPPILDGGGGSFDLPINNPPLVITNDNPQNCACLIGTPYVENGICKCTDTMQSPTTPIKQGQIIINSQLPQAQTGKGILQTIKDNPLLAGIGIVAIIALLKK